MAKVVHQRGCFFLLSCCNSEHWVRGGTIQQAHVWWKCAHCGKKVLLRRTANGAHKAILY